MQASYSRVECFKHCKYQYKLRYLDKLKLIQDPEPNNALIIGNSLHLGIETNVENAIDSYLSNFNVLSDLQINEIIKFKLLIPRVKELLNNVNIKYQEYMISNKRFKGIVDLITQNKDGTIDVFDFKYSNNIKNYLESGQLHVYKYFLEQQGFKVNKLGFIFIPKTSIRQKKDETLHQFRNRIKETLDSMEIQILEIKYNPNKIIEFQNGIIDCLEEKKFEKNVTKLCDWCDYKNYCIEGVDYMLLPKNEKRKINEVEYKKIWIYGLPFAGKTYLANDFPNALMLNTDGNIKFVDSPTIPIKDHISVEGRITNRTLAWKIFKDAIEELEKKQNDFETIVVDLLEDTYEHCRLFMYDKLGIEHESDDSFRAWDKVRTEFLSTIRKLMNLDYNIVLISHEDSSKDITKKTGDKITKIAPNLNEKVANKIAGMVDIVARAVKEEGEYLITFKTSSVEFGGGRITFNADKIPSDYTELMKLYDEANSKVKKKTVKSTDKTVKKTTKETAKKEEKTEQDSPIETPSSEGVQEVEEKKTKTRRRKKTE